MRKVIACIGVCLTITLCTTVLADGTNPSLDNDTKTEQYISAIYRHVDFGKFNRLSYEVFSKAYRGYLNLLNAGKLSAANEVITICDFSKPSSYKRMWIIDLCTKKVLFNTYVAHGQGSGDDGHLSFSNVESTHKSSLGFYVTGDTYQGDHGTSLHLDGMDEGFNDAAMDRGIVVHGADYVCDEFINSKDRLGRSWGCPAVPANLSLPIINTIRNGSCLFIYYPEHKYLKTSYWLNKKVENLPSADLYASSLPADNPAPRTRIIQYIHNGKVDSVKVVPISVQ